MTDKPLGFFQGTEMPNAGWWEALWPDPAGVLARVGIKSGMDVIHLCSGDGWFTLQIAKLARRVVAIDIDPALLEVARHRLHESNLSNCHFATGDAYDVARLWTMPVDFVFLANAFHGVPDQPRLASSVRDALNLRDGSPLSTSMRERASKQPCWASRADREPNCECRRNRQSKSPRLMA